MPHGAALLPHHHRTYESAVRRIIRFAEHERRQAERDDFSLSAIQEVVHRKPINRWAGESFRVQRGENPARLS
jgi:hypothetical protein